MTAWFERAPLLVVTGKGGVGKSTTVAALAGAVAHRGGRAEVVAVDGRPGLGRLIAGTQLTAEPRLLRRWPSGGQVWGRTLSAEAAFADYLELRGAPRLLRRAANAASLDMVAAATPGLAHLLLLGKIKELVKQADSDLVLVDAPAAGRAAPFLGAASSLLELVAAGPVRDQATEVAELLADSSRCQTTLVTLAEETPVTEVIELAFDIEDQLGMALTPVVVNACWPSFGGLDEPLDPALPAADRQALVAAAGFTSSRLEQQTTQIERLARSLPLPHVHLPHLGTPSPGPDQLDTLVRALTDIEPIGTTP